jgi:hypothetical protein
VAAAVRALAAAGVLAACGDGDSTGRGGFVKAPLDDPSHVIVSEEQPSVMDELGDPIKPAVVEIPVDSVRTGNAQPVR